MSLSAKVIITVRNPLYPGTPGESSTVKVEQMIPYDPLFKRLAKIPVKFDVPGEGVKTLICEVRNKDWEIDLTSNPNPNTIAIYNLSPSGVIQSGGLKY